MNLPVAVVYALAALAEIGGCYAFWAWARLERPALWLLPGLASLVAFAWLLTLPNTAAAGRSFAAYGGVYVLAALCWMRLVEGVVPDRWDILGGALCLGGCAIVLLGPRGASA